MSKLKVTGVVLFALLFIGALTMFIIASQFPEDEPMTCADDTFFSVHTVDRQQLQDSLLDFSQLDYAMVNLHSIETHRFRTDSGILRFRVLSDGWGGESIRFYLYNAHDMVKYIQALCVDTENQFVDFTRLTSSTSYRVVAVSDAPLFGISVLVCDGYCGTGICVL